MISFYLIMFVLPVLTILFTLYLAAQNPRKNG
jgi:hypothetical protein